MKISIISKLSLGITAALLPLTTQANSFQEASKHLDLDGSLIGYIDFDGDGEAIGNNLNTIYQEVVTLTPEMPPIPIDFNQLIHNLGFGSIRAAGISSKELEPDLFVNRSVVLLDGTPSGIFSLYGTEAHAFTAAEDAAADASGAVTTTLDVTVLRDTIIKILTQVMGPMGEGIAQQQLTQLVPGTDITANEIIESLSGKWDIAWHQSTTPEMTPTFKGWARIQGAAPLLARLQPMAAEMGVLFTDDATTLRADVSALLGDAPMGLFIEANKENGQLLIYSDATWTPNRDGARLKDTAAFKNLADRLPKEALAFTYSSGTNIDELLQAMEMIPGTAKYRDAARNAIELTIGGFLKPAIAATVLKDNALVTEQYGSYSTKQMLMILPAAIGGGVGAAMAIPAFQKVRTTSQEKAIINNLRQIASAADQYMLENAVNEVRFNQLGEYVRIQPVAGESYNDIVITTDMEEISVTLEDGSVISLPY